ncbi:hypothetical protein Ciccas_007600, partial [Cichlidogyrus casuarinus]
MSVPFTRQIPVILSEIAQAPVSVSCTKQGTSGQTVTFTNLVIPAKSKSGLVSMNIAAVTDTVSFSVVCTGASQTGTQFQTANSAGRLARVNWISGSLSITPTKAQVNYVSTRLLLSVNALNSDLNVLCYVQKAATAVAADDLLTSTNCAVPTTPSTWTVSPSLITFGVRSSRFQNLLLSRTTYPSATDVQAAPIEYLALICCNSANPAAASALAGT